ncbi:MAG: 50S ribosomal protein L1 [Alphaproteobacteria bacterium]
MALNKRMKKIKEGFDNEKLYSLDEAITLVKEKATAKFDETVDIAVQLGVDPRHADQNVRGVISLPHSIGKNVRVAVFAKDKKAEEATAAGADLVGSDELLAEIQDGKINFDRCIATPDMMGVIGRVAKILGPKGLMPNPKLGTVTMDVAEAVKLAKAGQVEFRVEKTGIIHAGIGKASLSPTQLTENISALLGALRKARPSGSKGTYVQKIAISSSMGVGIKVDLATTSAS